MVGRYKRAQKSRRDNEAPLQTLYSCPQNHLTSTTTSPLKKQMEIEEHMKPNIGSGIGSPLSGPPVMTYATTDQKYQLSPQPTNIRAKSQRKRYLRLNFAMGESVSWVSRDAPGIDLRLRLCRSTPDLTEPHTY
jgi:hypothetical protein